MVKRIKFRKFCQLKFRQLITFGDWDLVGVKFNDRLADNLGLRGRARLLMPWFANFVAHISRNDFINVFGHLVANAACDIDALFCRHHLALGTDLVSDSVTSLLGHLVAHLVVDNVALVKEQHLGDVGSDGLADFLAFVSALSVVDGVAVVEEGVVADRLGHGHASGFHLDAGGGLHGDLKKRKFQPTF